MTLEMSPVELVRQIALAEGVLLTDEEADYVLWNATGWPCFWPDKRAASPAATIRVQVKEWCRNLKERSDA